MKKMWYSLWVAFGFSVEQIVEGSTGEAHYRIRSGVIGAVVLSQMWCWLVMLARVEGLYARLDGARPRGMAIFCFAGARFSGRRNFSRVAGICEVWSGCGGCERYTMISYQGRRRHFPVFNAHVFSPTIYEAGFPCCCLWVPRSRVQ